MRAPFQWKPYGVTFDNVMSGPTKEDTAQLPVEHACTHPRDTLRGHVRSLPVAMSVMRNGTFCTTTLTLPLKCDLNRPDILLKSWSHTEEGSWASVLVAIFLIADEMLKTVNFIFIIFWLELSPYCLITYIKKTRRR